MDGDSTPGADAPRRLRFTRLSADRGLLELAGAWEGRRDREAEEAALKEMSGAPALKVVEFRATDLGRWDSGLLAFLFQCAELCRGKDIRLDDEGLPAGARRLLALAISAPERKDARQEAAAPGLLTRVGEGILRLGDGGRALLEFVGECGLALGRLSRGRARCRWGDVLAVMEATGPQALPIVSLINFLVGLILGFVGAVQLSRFGASIYVADLVSVATLREMGSMMTGIILCGRTGAAFAAHLGTMKVNEEIDALKTCGISPIEFLVLPRLLAMGLMAPLLCLFANLAGVLGGFVVAVGMLDLTLVEYWNESVAAMTLTDLGIGLTKGSVFGLLLTVAGCLRGLQCGQNAAAVGQATTSAVVSGITAIIAADAVFAVLCHLLGL